jgi:hypothetical protein
MSNKYLTTSAAAFCSSNGRKVSARTLQKWRLRAPNDPGERGPRYWRDPVSGYVFYLEDDLRAWIAELDKRLVERAPSPQPKQLCVAA